MKRISILTFIPLLACFVGFTAASGESFFDMFKPDTEKPFSLHRMAGECHKFRSKRCPLPERFNAHNIDPYTKDESGRTVSEIARQRYEETGNEYCKRYAEEFEKYAERYRQKERDKEVFLN